MRAVLCAAALGGGLLATGSASADTTHVVARGHTLEAISNRYQVSVKAIAAANKIKDLDRLKAGDTLVIPGVPNKSGKDGKNKSSDAKGAKVERGKDPKKTKPPTYAMKPKAPGLLHLSRIANSEETKVRPVDRRGKPSPQSMKTIEKLLRSASGQSKPVDPRLVSVLTRVSNHFGGRKIEIISGYRPYTATQHAAHSNHNVGKAIDFRIAGVPNEVVRDFCRTLKNVGVGYYPNSTFVHLDVRSSPVYWIDYSRPGEPPRYNDPNVQADEGTSDVGADVLMPVFEPPSLPPPAPPDGADPNAPPASEDDRSAPPAPAPPSVLERAAGAATATARTMPLPSGPNLSALDK